MRKDSLKPQVATLPHTMQGSATASTHRSPALARLENCDWCLRDARHSREQNTNVSCRPSPLRKHAIQSCSIVTSANIDVRISRVLRFWRCAERRRRVRKLDLAQIPPFAQPCKHQLPVPTADSRTMVHTSRPRAVLLDQLVTVRGAAAFTQRTCIWSICQATTLPWTLLKPRRLAR